MLCPLKLSNSSINNLDTQDCCECEKEKCAWWVEIKPIDIHDRKKGHVAVRSCAFKVVAEK